LQLGLGLLAIRLRCCNERAAQHGEDSESAVAAAEHCPWRAGAALPRFEVE
jgi:hypothetical protein